MTDVQQQVKEAIDGIVESGTERGLQVADYRHGELVWPEFGAQGKEAASVRHFLTRTVGAPGMPADTTPEDCADLRATRQGCG